MMVINKIQSLISDLSIQEDFDLINLLLLKIKSIESGNSKIIFDDFTAIEVGIAIASFKKHFLSELKKDCKYIRAVNIIEKRNCEQCKHSIQYTYYKEKWNDKNDNSIVCKSCDNRISSINNLLIKMEKETKQMVDKHLTKDMILMKMVIQKINIKLTKIKNYETSKQ